MNINTNNYILSHYKHLLDMAAMNGESVYKNEFNKLANLSYVRSLNKNSISIRDLFRDYWDDFKLVNKDKHIRDSIHDNVEAMMDCMNISKGHLFFECPKCDNYHILGIPCHSRFCTTCGHKYRDARSIEIQKKLLKVKHRHFVFSVPFDLRPFFWKCRELFDCLFKSVNEALHFSIKLSKKDKREDYRLGFVAFLHTSGRSLNLHPHIHVLLAEALVNKNGDMKNYFFFPFERLRKTFMYIFLTKASKYLKKYADKSLYKEFNRLRTTIIKNYSDGFYVYGPKNESSEGDSIDSAEKVADYIARYASHPPISESNILSLESDEDSINKDFITWQYTDSETDEIVLVNEHVFSFIAKLIRHIPNKGFHQLRYYGFYSNKTKRINGKIRLVSPNRIDTLRKRLYFRIMILLSYKYDPLMCVCGTIMVYNHNFSYLPNKEKDFRTDG